MIRLPRIDPVVEALEHRPRPATWRAPWLSASLTLLVFAVDRLQWDLAMRRDAVLQGGLLRLVTGHFCHFNRAHLLGDALAFAFWAACLEQRGRALLASTLVVTSVGSSLFLIAFFPQVREYRGLSAVDCALAAELIVLALADRLRARDARGAAVFAGVGLAFAAKTAFELRAGRAILAPHLGDSVSLLPAAHLAGIVLGLACLGAFRALPDRLLAGARRSRSRRPRSASSFSGGSASRRWSPAASR